MLMNWLRSWFKKSSNQPPYRPSNLQQQVDYLAQLDQPKPTSPPPPVALNRVLTPRQPTSSRHVTTNNSLQPTDDGFPVSLALGYALNDGIVGGLLGGNLAGGVIGDLLNNDQSETKQESPPEPREPEPQPEVPEHWSSDSSYDSSSDSNNSYDSGGSSSD